VINPNGESSCDASLAASDVAYHPIGLIAWLTSARPIRNQL
jgi:hypothetical protein